MEKVEVLRACCCVAGADGKCTEDELKMIKRLAEEVGVGKASLAAMIDRGEKDPDFYKEQFRVLKSDQKQTMAILLEAALANRQIGEEEERVLKGLSANLEIPEEISHPLIQKSREVM